VRDEVAVGGSSSRSSFMPHFGHCDGRSVWTSGCIGQVYVCMIDDARKGGAAAAERRRTPGT
jgi:hypothetical protein